jgi:hypothetical protein
LLEFKILNFEICVKKVRNFQEKNINKRQKNENQQKYKETSEEP